MKKMMMALTILLLITGAGWAAEVDNASSPEQMDSGVSAPASDLETPEPSIATPDIQDSESSAAPSDLKDPESPPEQSASDEALKAPDEEGHGIGHAILLYVPNRIMDVFDIARLRVRVGPGAAIGVRATKLVSVFAGIYGSVYAGLPGPRLEPKIVWPIGLENCAGVGVSLADLTTGGSTSPNYSNTEVGVSVHALLVGVDAGVDPLEVFDLVLGFLFIDIRGDDF